MRTLRSLSTIEQANLSKFYDVMRKCDPELFLIKLALEETQINPMLVPKIIRALSSLSIGSGFGKVQIFMSARVITQIEGVESVKVNEEVEK